MLKRPWRVIPCLLLKGSGLYKTVKFKKPSYLGDPVNIIRIFNDKRVDEIVVFDIEASIRGGGPNMKLIGELASECFMPLTYGGGVTKLEQMRELYRAGVEKICLNCSAAEKPELLRAAASEFGSCSVIACMDVKRGLFGGSEVLIKNATTRVSKDPVSYARSLTEAGAGEIVINSIDRDGTMDGYDHELIKLISEAVGVPVIACGGARDTRDLARVVKNSSASAAAAGSLFVYQPPHRAVLISYPSESDMLKEYSLL